MSDVKNLEFIHQMMQEAREPLLRAGDPFARVANIIDAEPPAGINRFPDDTPLRNVIPGAWPTVGDLRKLRDALVAAGWRKEQ